jgi:DNA primase
VPRYTDESRDRVREAVDILDLIGTRTELRRAGVDAYSGLCPFHEERTPSFSVTPSKKVYYCFGCQASGDVFTFVRETQGFDFVGALEWLADRYNVPLELAEENPRAAERRRRHDRLRELLERACAYYERCLWESPEAARAREYLAARGLDEAVLRTFRVGWAPSAWDRVLLASRRGGFSERELLDAGLVQRSAESPGRVYDRFRARITFPLCDRRGRVVGFGARTMKTGEPAKYLNSAENEIFHKREQLFGLHLASAAAAKAGRVVLCEGYTDVIAMHQAGVTNCVGLMGTALTDEQLKLLADLAPTVVLALDADGAGRAAMLKAASAIGARERIELRVAPLAPGSDPADVLERDGPAGLPALVDGAVAFVRFRVERILASGDGATPEGRDRMLAELAPVFAQLGLGAMREDLEREVAARLGVSERTVETLLAASAGADRRPAAQALAAPPHPGERMERAFLELCIALPDAGAPLLGKLDLDALFASQLTRRAAQRLHERIDTSPSEPDDAELARLLTELAVRASTLEATPAQLEVARRQLELARIGRAIDAARTGESGSIEQLARERSELQEEIGDWVLRALEETGARAG